MSTISTLFGEKIQTKVCIKCKEEKSLSEFATRTRDKNGHGKEHRNDCRSCQKEQSKILKELKKTYPAPDPNSYICPTCLRGKVDLEYAAWSPFVLDHNHITGKAMGWICQDCNTAAARIRNAENARRLADYLDAEDRGVYLGVVDRLQEKSCVE